MACGHRSDLSCERVVLDKGAKGPHWWKYKWNLSTEEGEESGVVEERAIRHNDHTMRTKHGCDGMSADPPRKHVI